ncbi:MAG: potassium transporter TrkG [Pseudomonadota bacterium]
MAQGTSALHYAIRPTAVAKILGQLAFLLGLLSLVPLAVSLHAQEFAISQRYGLVIAVLLILAALSRALPAVRNLQVNEALAIAALAFVLAPLLMSIPIMASGLHWQDAAFEAVSAITTTGLSMHASTEGLPQTFLFARSWMQWYGGLGVVVLSLALLMGHEMAARRLSESSGVEGLETSAREHARRTTVVYLALTAVGLAILWPLTGDFFHSLTHVLAAISTGGFSSLEGGLAGFDDWPTRLAIMLVCLLGAVPFALYFQASRGGWRASLRDPELHTLLLLGLIVTLVLSVSIQAHQGFEWRESAGHALVLALSAQTTAGFSTLGVETMDPLSKLVMIVSMTIGGGLGSTAGGFKILRLLILMRLVQAVVQRAAMPPHAVHAPRLGDRRLTDEDLQRALLLILLFGVVIVLSWLPFVAYGHDPLDALFEVVSATATVGLSTGITSPELPSLLKGVLMFDMWFGRLEIIALLVVLYPPSWIGRRSQST